MVDIQSPTAEIRRGKKERKMNKPQHENIMVCPITEGDHNEKPKPFWFILFFAVILGKIIRAVDGLA